MLLNSYRFKPAGGMPLDLPGGLGWYDFSDTSTLTLSGPEITAVRDKSGNDNHLTTQAGRFQTGGAVNGLNAAISTSDDSMKFSKFNPNFPTNSYYVFAVFGSTNALCILLDGNDGFNNPYFFSSRTGGEVYSSLNGTNILINGGAATSNGSINIHSVNANTTNATASFNDLLNSATSSVGFSINRVSTDRQTGYGVAGTICEIFFGNVALTPAQITAVKDYLKQKWIIPPPGTDPYYAFVTSIIGGQSMPISDVKGNLVSPVGGVVVGTAYNPAGAIDFDGNNDSVNVYPSPSEKQFAPGLAPFCIEGFTIGAPSPALANQLIFDTSGSGSATNGMFLEYAPQRQLIFSAADTGPGFTSGSAGTYYTDSVARHWFINRDVNNVLRMGFNGTILVNKAGFTTNIPNPLNTFTLGGYVPDGGLLLQKYKGAIWGVRVTMGESRYTGAAAATYTIPTLPYPTSGPTVYSTWNPYDKGTAVTLTNGNLTMTYTTSLNSTARSVIGKVVGKWYWEIKINAKSAASGIDFGVRPASYPIGNTLYLQTGIYRLDTALFAVNDILGVAFDASTGVCQAYKNGVLLGNMTGPITISEPWKAVYGDDNAPAGSVTANFGSTPFVHTPPVGFNPGLYVLGA